MSSGSSREVSSVEPTRSQNITVSCRRSAPSVRGASDTAGRIGAASANGLPQPPQNFAEASLSKPQAGQGKGNDAPHWAQKRLFAPFSAMQLGQRILCPRRRSKRCRLNITQRRSILKRRLREPVADHQDSHRREFRWHFLAYRRSACDGMVFLPRSSPYELGRRRYFPGPGGGPTQPFSCPRHPSRVGTIPNIALLVHQG